MTEERKATAIARILVALDASRSSFSALEAAAILAEAMQSELYGLFVEDAELMALANLPFSREIRTPGGAIRNLDPDNLEMELQARMAAARTAVQAAAARRGLRWNFRSVRGNVHSEVSAAAGEVDVLCIGRQGSASYQKSRMGGTARIVLQGRATVLIADDLSRCLDGPVAVVADESAATLDRIRLAAEIARKTGNDLVVLVPARGQAGFADAKARLRERLPRAVEASYLPVDPADPSTPPQTVRPGQFGLIVSGCDAGKALPPSLEYMARAAGCPLMLVPGEPA